MSEQTLTVVFIGMVAVSWALIAVVVAAVGWRALKVMKEVQAIAAQVRTATEGAARDVRQLRESLIEQSSRFKGLVEWLLSFASAKFTAAAVSPRRSRKKPVVEVDI